MYLHEALEQYGTAVRRKCWRSGVRVRCDSTNCKMYARTFDVTTGQFHIHLWNPNEASLRANDWEFDTPDCNEVPKL